MGTATAPIARLECALAHGSLPVSELRVSLTRGHCIPGTQDCRMDRRPDNDTLTNHPRQLHTVMRSVSHAPVQPTRRGIDFWCCDHGSRWSTVIPHRVA